MKSRVPKHPHWRRSEEESGRGVPDSRPSRGRLPVLVCLLAVLGVSVGAAGVTSAMGPSSAERAQVGAAAVAAPGQAPIATYTASITNGATQNDLYEWLTGRAGTIVHLVLSVSKPVAADVRSRPRSIAMSSNCTTANPPSNCGRSLNLAGTRYLVYGDAAGAVTLVNNVYQVNAYVAVEPVTLDRNGMYTLPLRIVVLNGPGNGEDE
jgi:hypothetical protein